MLRQLVGMLVLAVIFVISVSLGADAGALLPCMVGIAIVVGIILHFVSPSRKAPQKFSWYDPPKPQKPAKAPPINAPRVSGIPKFALPIRLRPAHFVWPVILLLILLIAETSKSWLLSWFFYVMTVLVICSFMLTRRPARLLGTRRQLSILQAEIGQPVTVQVSFDFTRPSGPGWMLAQDTLPPAFRALNPCGSLFNTNRQSSSSFSYRITGQQRGYYSIGPVSISCGDLFGLDQVTTPGEDATFITIYPRIVPIPPLRVPSNRPIGEARSTKRLYEDSTRIVGIRDYTPGDTQSKIHWKATARTGNLMTKMCEPSSSVEVHIILNLFHADYPNGSKDIELACTTAASIAAGLLLDKQIVGLESNGYDGAARHRGPIEAPLVKAGKGEEQFVQIMNLVGRLEPSGGPVLADYITQVHSRLPWTATIMVVTHQLNEQSAFALEGLKRSGFELAVAIVGAGATADTSAVHAAALGIPMAIIPTEKHLATLEFWQPGR